MHCLLGADPDAPYLPSLVAAPRRLEIFRLVRNELLFASAFT
jgi:hypothetical protein